MLFAPWLDRDDLDQEAAIGRLEAARAFRRGGDAEAFARMVAKRRIRDAVRAATSGKQRILSEAARDVDVPLGEDVLAVVLRREALRETLAAVAALAPRQRRCLVRQVGGSSMAEIAAAEDLTTKQVDNALSWGRRTLRERRGER